MKYQLSFVHNNERYVTLFGAKEYLASFLEENSNVANYSKLIVSGGAMAALKGEFGLSSRNIPIIEDAVVTKSGNKFLVEGKVSIDGTSYVCAVKEDSIVIEGVTDVVETVPEPVAAPVEEPVVQELPEVEELVEEIAETTETEVEPVKTTEIPSDVDLHSVKTTSGITLGNTTSNTASIFIGAPSKACPGISFGGSELRPKPVKRPNRLTRSTDRFERQEQRQYVVMEAAEIKEFPETSEVQVVKAPEVKTDLEPSLWVEPVAQVKEPAPTEEPEVTEDNKVAKQEFRAKLSPEINEVLGKIPPALLGPITEFTTRQIDTEALKDRGYAYCVDNRWHHSGRWYCIDVINDTARYFYNSHLDVSVSIPVATLREWSKLIGKGDM